jgi:F-type H+-transporting ATPase subunit epsilon
MSESGEEKKITGVFVLRVLTPERMILEANVNWLQAPTEDGMLGIWPLHTPLIDTLAPGIIEYESEEKVYRKRVRGGLLHVQRGRVLILTEGLEDVAASERTEHHWEKAFVQTTE